MKKIPELLLLLTLASCAKEEEPFIVPPTPDPEVPGGDTPTAPSVRDEQYRPQVHFTPNQNWMNDPNGMVYVNGTWHLFYQYNPYGNDWGNMSWGHATSTDLMHWSEQSVSLVRDDLGDIFSGSCVIDSENAAGFGKDAMIAFYTSAGEWQQQSIAYSTDGGKSFTKFSGNPILANNSMGDFRDPKVFYHAESKQWVMSIARGWTYAIDFYTSTDLKRWTFASSFTTPDYPGCNRGQWECPDLIPFRVKDSGETKWVLIVSVNPGGPVTGSGTMYFVGDFDGKNFKADSQEYPLYVDYGMDNYAGVTWSGAPEDRKVFIGWMNNWQYSGNVPCSPWRSANTLPRELSVVKAGSQYLLANTVVKELDGIASEWKALSNQFDEAASYHVQFNVDITQNHTIRLSNGKDYYDIEIKANAAYNNIADGTILTRRNGDSGDTSFNGLFSLPSMQAPLYRQNQSEVTVDLYVDQSSVEMVVDNGVTTVTNLVFPRSIYNSLTIDGQLPKGQYRALKSVWK